MVNSKIKISIDYDGTLSRKDVQIFVKELIDKDFDVWVVTSRYSTESSLEKGWLWIEKQNQELFNVTDSIGIDRDKIVFTNNEKKILFLKGKGFLFHLDDDIDELLSIMESDDSCKPLNVDHFEWRYNCEELIK